MQRITRISIATLFLLAVGGPCLADEASAKVRTSALETLDYLALFGYMAIIVIVGIYFSRGEKTTDDYFLAGRRVPWWAATLSIFSTSTRFSGRLSRSESYAVCGPLRAVKITASGRSIAPSAVTIGNPKQLPSG